MILDCVHLISNIRVLEIDLQVFDGLVSFGFAVCSLLEKISFWEMDLSCTQFVFGRRRQDGGWVLSTHVQGFVFLPFLLPFQWQWHHHWQVLWSLGPRIIILITCNPCFEELAREREFVHRNSFLIDFLSNLNITEAFSLRLVLIIRLTSFHELICLALRMLHKSRSVIIPSLVCFRCANVWHFLDVCRFLLLRFH